jgi:hypothetical protein
MPKTSKPGPRLAVVAGAFTTTLFGGDAPFFLPTLKGILKPPIKVMFKDNKFLKEQGIGPDEQAFGAPKIYNHKINVC